ncbi:unnamed protein product, partial [Prorocentrum cordatum]
RGALPSQKPSQSHDAGWASPRSPRHAVAGRPGCSLRLPRGARGGARGRAGGRRAALLRRRVQPWPQLLADLGGASGPDCVVVLCGAAPGNLGAVLRACALLGVTVVCALGGPSRTAIRKALRTSQVERRLEWDVRLVPVPESTPPAAAVAALRAAGLALVGLAAEERAGGKPRRRLPPPRGGLGRPRPCGRWTWRDPGAWAWSSAATSAMARTSRAAWPSSCMLWAASRSRPPAR